MLITLPFTVTNPQLFLPSCHNFSDGHKVMARVSLQSAFIVALAAASGHGCLPVSDGLTLQSAASPQLGTRDTTQIHPTSDGNTEHRANTAADVSGLVPAWRHSSRWLVAPLSPDILGLVPPHTAEASLEDQLTGSCGGPNLRHEPRTFYPRTRIILPTAGHKH